jgi:hypothetical protein
MVINFLLVVNLIILSQEFTPARAVVLSSQVALKKSVTVLDPCLEDEDLTISSAQLKGLVDFAKIYKSNLPYLLKETVKKLPPCHHDKFLQEVISTIKQNSIEITLESDQKQDSSYYIDQNLLINKFISQDNILFLKKMIKAGFVININNMQHAVMMGNSATNQLILDSLDEAKVNAPCLLDGANILILAIKQQRPLNVIKTLINHPKIDITATDALGNNAYYFAAHYLPDNQEILELLQKKFSNAHKPKRHVCCCLTDYFAKKYYNLDD